MIFQRNTKRCSLQRTQIMSGMVHQNKQTLNKELQRYNFGV
nr:MAG TPA: hypothetical protein [Caudoviricetes sp.]